MQKRYMNAYALFESGDPYGIRTHVAGVRGRSLRPLDQRAVALVSCAVLRSKICTVFFASAKKHGTPSRARTVDTLIKSQVLYQLS